jgi:hypothetical protein
MSLTTKPQDNASSTAQGIGCGGNRITGCRPVNTQEGRAMAVSCDFYGVEEEKITLEVEERFLREQQLFEFEGERYIILSVVWTKDGPKANVMPYWEYVSLQDKRPRLTAITLEEPEESSVVREINQRRRPS